MTTLPNDIKTTEQLLLWFMHYFAKEFKNHAILKGGMVLRLLNSPRYTNDLDYLFVPFKSKNNVFELLEKSLSILENIEHTISMDSKCLRAVVKFQTLSVQIEATVADECPSEPLTTAALTNITNQLPVVVSVQQLTTALAHKIAAWNERDLYRDLYDIYFYISILDKMPDMPTLLKRLSNVKKGRVNKGREMSLNTLIELLTQKKEQFNSEEMNAELSPLLLEIELIGLDLKIKVSLQRLIDYLDRQI